MIPRSTKGDVITHGFKNPQKMQIECNESAYQILQRDIYTDVILAIVRELSTNAYDSHIFAGTQARPFRVHMPNALEPYFEIRDYGEGLTEEEAYDTYSTFFKGDERKIKSNDFIGFMGLGSKSPLGYVDNFTTTSFKDGVRSVYNIYKDKIGQPCIATIHQGPTDESNGVCIQIAVKQNDCDKFVDRAVQVYKYFKTRPEIIGCDKLPIKEDELVLVGKGWYISSKRTNRWDSSKNSLAIMGNLSYPIQTTHLSYSYGTPELTLLDRTLVIKFPVGSLDIQASREQLNYTERTIENIKKRLGIIVKDYEQLVQKKINECENYMSACAFASQTLPYSPGQSSLQYKGRDLETTLLNSVLKGVVQNSDDFVIINFYQCGNVKQDRDCAVRYDNLDGRTKFYHQNIKTGSHVRCKHEINSNTNIDKIYLIKCNSADLKRITDKIGFDKKDLLNTSDIDYKIVKKTNSVKLNKIWGYKYIKGQYSHYTVTSYWNGATIDITKPQYYVQFKQYHVVNDLLGWTKQQPQDLNGILSSIEEIKCCDKDIGDKIIGITKTKIKHFVANGWTELMPYLKGKIEHEFTKDIILKAMHNYVHKDGIGITYSTDFLDKLYNITKNKYVSRIIEIKKQGSHAETKTDIYALYRLAETFKIDIKDKIKYIRNKNNFQVEVSQFDERYPMLCRLSKSIDNYGDRILMSDAKDYLELVDKCNPL